MRERTVCLLSLGTDAYLEGGLARLRGWSLGQGKPITFVALDSLELINERVLGREVRTVNHFVALLAKVFQPGEYDFYLSSQMEADPRYILYLDTITGLFQSSRSLQHLGQSQTFRSLHRQLASIGVKNQRHQIVRELSNYLIREISLLLYLFGEFEVVTEVSLHTEMPFRERLRSVLPTAMAFPTFIALKGATTMSDLVLEALLIPIGDGKRKLGPIDLTVRAGSILGIVGPNGVGKSTLLKTLGGHLSPTSGKITLSSKDVTAISPLGRNVASVFQDSALFPNRTLAENVAIGTKLGSVRKRDELAYGSGGLLGILDLANRSNTRASELSGGEQQLGAIARALNARPNLLLLDEPGSSIDQIRKRKALSVIREYVQQTATACVLVTHDPELLFSICDSLLVLSSDGQQLAVGKAANFVDGGGSMTAAELIGLPNLFRCEISGDSKATIPDLDVDLSLPPKETIARPVGIYLPPESISLIGGPTRPEIDSGITIRGRVQFRASLKAGQVVLFRTESMQSGNKTRILGRSVLLTITGFTLNVAGTNEITLGVAKSDIRWMAK